MHIPDSPTNLAQDTAKKIRQYLDAGAQQVWIVYPALRLIETHFRDGKRDVVHPASLTEAQLFGGHAFTLLLVGLFNQRLEV